MENAREQKKQKSALRVITRDLESLRPWWEKLQWHPNTDLDYFKLINSLRQQEPYVVAVTRGEDVIALAVGRLGESTLRCSLGYKNVYTPRVRELSLVYGGFMGDNSEEVTRLLMSGLLKPLKERLADVLSLYLIRNDSPLYRLARSHRPLWCRDFLPKHQIHRTLKLPKNGASLFDHMKSKHRSELRRQVKVLERDFAGRWRIDCLQTSDSVGRFCADAEHIVRKSYQRALGVGFVNNEEGQAAIRLGAEQGSFVGYVLYLHDTPCAYWAGNISGPIFYLGSTAFDPAYRKYDIGTVLLVKVLGDLVSRCPGLTEIDFGLGDAKYKSFFCTDHWDESHLYVFAPALRSIGINLLRTPLLAGTQAAQGILRWLEWEEKLKRWWRTKVQTIPGMGNAPVDKPLNETV